MPAIKYQSPQPYRPTSFVGDVAIANNMFKGFDKMNVFKQIEQARSDAYDTKVQEEAAARQAATQRLKDQLTSQQLEEGRININEMPAKNIRAQQKHTSDIRFTDQRVAESEEDILSSQLERKVTGTDLKETQRQAKVQELVSETLANATNMFEKRKLQFIRLNGGADPTEEQLKQIALPIGRLISNIPDITQEEIKAANTDFKEYAGITEKEELAKAKAASQREIYTASSIARASEKVRFGSKNFFEQTEKIIGEDRTGADKAGLIAFVNQFNANSIDKYDGTIHWEHKGNTYQVRPEHVIRALTMERAVRDSQLVGDYLTFDLKPSERNDFLVKALEEIEGNKLSSYLVKKKADEQTAYELMVKNNNKHIEERKKYEDYLMQNSTK